MKRVRIPPHRNCLFQTSPARYHTTKDPEQNSQFATPRKVKDQRVPPHEPPGSTPAALMAAAASGEIRNFNDTLLASGSRAVTTIPANDLVKPKAKWKDRKDDE